VNKNSAKTKGKGLIPFRSRAFAMIYFLGIDLIKERGLKT